MNKISFSLLVISFLLSGMYFSYSASVISALTFSVLGFTLAIFSQHLNSRPVILRAIMSLIALLVLVAAILSFNEAVHFDNYIYSRLHIFPDRFAVFIGLLVGMFYLRHKISGPKFIYLAFLTVFAFGFSGIISALGKSAANLAYWSHLPTGNAERSIRKMYGEDLKYINFLNRSIPATARVVIPPASAAYRHTSDLWIMSSLLYPHQIVQFTSPLNLLPGDYVLISSEADNQRAQSTWPDFALMGATVVIYDWQADSGRIWSGPIDFHRSVPVSNPWGYLVLSP